MPRKFQQGKLLKRDDVANPYWYVKVSVPVLTADGRQLKRENRIIGPCSEMTKRQAEQVRSQVLEAVNSHKLVASAQVKFKDLTERYLKAEIPILGAGARGRYESCIGVHLLPAFGDMRLGEIDACKIQEWLNSKSDYAWWTRQGLKGVLGAMFAAAKRWGLHEGDNPTLGVRIGKKTLAREKRLLTSGQLQLILAGVQDRERFIVTILYALGLRISECLGLKWQDVDLTNGLLSIRRRWYRGDLIEETKSEAGTRVLALGPLVEEFKRRYPGPQAGFVFGDPLDPPDDRELLRWNFRPVVKRLGLYYTGFGWHAFRRANVTLRQTLGGATPVEAMKAAGHGSVDMTLLYTLSDKSREADQVAKLLGALYEMPGDLTKQ